MQCYDMNEVNAVSTVFDIIEAITAYRGYSLRELAMRAEMPYTTLSSIMTRRSIWVSKRTLESVSKALEVDFHDLIPRSSEELATSEGTHITRYPSECSDEFMRATLSRIIGDNYIQYLSDSRPQTARNATPHGYERQQTNHAIARRSFTHSVYFVLNKLNDEGLMEAMRRVLDVASNPQYCISTDSHTSSNTKEDEPCQENEP